VKLSTRLIERYIAAAVIPYFLLALILLTSVLIAQQSSRFAEIVGQVQAPFQLILAIIVNIAPSLLLFTIPMSVLAGTLIGFSRMGSDSELTALRAAGVGEARLLLAPMLIGILGTILTLYIAIVHTPYAARQLRDATLRAAQDRLKSPIQPGAFATDIGDKVIYVRSGDEARGVWQGVFIFSQDASGRALLVTAEDGRLDSSQEVAELVLRDANAITFNLPTTSTTNGATSNQSTTNRTLTDAKRAGVERRKGSDDAVGFNKDTQFISERSAQLRIKLEDRLGVLVERLRARPTELDELPWNQLVDATRNAATPQQKLAAQIVQHKKLSLGFASVCFAMLGAVIGLRVKRGGRGLGVLLSLGLMIVYYLLALSGEQLARTSTVPVIAGVWGATLISLAFALLCLLAPRLSIRRASLTNRRSQTRVCVGKDSRNETKETIAPLPIRRKPRCR
jgi:lipopolysaccharide export LptBFGC system permease protein LptF